MQSPFPSSVVAGMARNFALSFLRPLGRFSRAGAGASMDAVMLPAASVPLGRQQASRPGDNLLLSSPAREFKNGAQCCSGGLKSG